MSDRPVAVHDLQEWKRRGERIPAITAYDYTSAQIVEAAGIPVVLVGDTLGMVVLGHRSTIPVTLDDMIHHVRAVMRAQRRALVIGDLPFMSYQVSASQALTSAARLVQEGGCHAVKLEGGRDVAHAVERIVGSGIPVMGHIGYTPQSVHRFGRKRVMGKRAAAAEGLLRDAQALERAGVFGIVLECVPIALAAEISRRTEVPTIGIGSGPRCDGEVQVFHDLLGLYSDFVPRHTKRVLELSAQIRDALAGYASEVRSGEFPEERHAAQMDEQVLARALERVDACW
jgi:3-methyl-2-oxobutanoate hydroxymethyltransferase